jgi:hypothetical protein
MNWKEYRGEQHALYLVDTITDMKSNRDLETLEQRRMRTRVMMFYKITNNSVAIDPNQYVTHQQKIPWSTNKLQFQTYITTKDYL